MRILLLILCFAVVGCTPTRRSNIPVLSTVDAVGQGVSKLLGWCEDNDVSVEDILKAKQALDDKRYLEAAALAAALVEKVGDREDVPEEIAMLAGLVKGAAAAQAIDEGMTAISQPPKD